MNDATKPATPGPWILSVAVSPYGSTDWWAVKTEEAPRVMIAVLPGQRANALLAAAAPDLLAALKAYHAQAVAYHAHCGHGEPGAVSECDEICEQMPQAEAAIAKAEGK